MFGTIIVDSYSKDEAELIANSIDEICSPMDNGGWASAGIYCFGTIIPKKSYILD